MAIVLTRLDRQVMAIAPKIGRRFLTTGGGTDKSNGANPISVARKDAPLEFAAGVNVADVVRYVLQCR